MAEGIRVLFVSIPGLCQEDVEGGSAPFLRSIMDEGDSAALVPGLPACACTAQADMLTGRRPTEHGMVADAYYERATHEVLCRPVHSAAVQAPRLWDLFKAHESTALSAVLFFDQIIYSKADVVLVPEPVVMEDGGLLSHCYSKPRALYEELMARLHWFDLESYEGRSDSQQAMRWIGEAAEYVSRELKPRLTMVRFPHLDHALTRHGPGSQQSRKVLSSLDALLGHLIQGFRSEEGEGAVIVVSEYGFCGVRGVVHINRMLRDEGLLSVREIGGREFIDFEMSRCFAVTNYQLAHLYCAQDALAGVTDMLRGTVGVQAVLGAQEKRASGLDHARSGELVCLSEPEFWFTFDWWETDALAPSFPRQGSRAKPGCNPLELFEEPGTGFVDVPTDVSLVRGSHGLTPDFGGSAGVILCDALAAHELRINRLEQTEVLTMLGHLLR